MLRKPRDRLRCAVVALKGGPIDHRVFDGHDELVAKEEVYTVRRSLLHGSTLYIILYTMRSRSRR
jgi:hypothetical protein